LPGTFSFRLLNRLHNPVVIESSKKMMCPHVTNWTRLRRRRNYRRRN
jgi:hypothetical protein